MDNNERAQRIIKEQEIISGVMYDALRNSEHGSVCVVLNTHLQAVDFKRQCSGFLKANNINGFTERKDTIKFENRYPITFRSTRGVIQGYYKILEV